MQNFAPDYASEDSFIHNKRKLKKIVLNSEVTTQQYLYQNHPLARPHQRRAHRHPVVSLSSDSECSNSSKLKSSGRYIEFIKKVPKSDGIENTHILIFPKIHPNLQSFEKENQAVMFQEVKDVGTNVNQPIIVSPIYTDENDVELNDDDPTFDYESLSGGTKRNYFLSLFLPDLTVTIIR